MRHKLKVNILSTTGDIIKQSTYQSKHDCTLSSFLSSLEAYFRKSYKDFGKISVLEREEVPIVVQDDVRGSKEIYNKLINILGVN